MGFFCLSCIPWSSKWIKKTHLKCYERTSQINEVRCRKTHSFKLRYVSVHISSISKFTWANEHKYFGFRIQMRWNIKMNIILKWNAHSLCMAEWKISFKRNNLTNSFGPRHNDIKWTILKRKCVRRRSFHAKMKIEIFTPLNLSKTSSLTNIIILIDRKQWSERGSM